MQHISTTIQAPADLPALIADLAAMISDWDPAQPPAELAAALKKRLVEQPTTSIGKRRGKSMSRRRGQTPNIEKHGRFYTVRGREDEEGQEKRVHKRIKISPIDRNAPGWLNRSEREREARKAVAKLDHNGEVVVRNSEPVKSRQITFGEQCDRYLDQLRKREKPAASSTITRFEEYMKKWLKPMLGDLPLGKVNNGVVKRITDWMKKGGPMPFYQERNANGK